MKVFLSSTAQDLEAYRRVADDTILRLSQQSIAMERFGSLPDTPVEECERLARESDVVVCIVAHRYGFVPEKERGSITRREVEAAHKAGKDVLVWIIDDSHPWTEKKEQDLLADQSVVTDPAKVAEVAEGVAGLLEFKAWLRTTFTPDNFTTPNDLGRKIAVALANYVNGRAAPPVPQNRISVARLPTTSSELFGRETELQFLDNAWSDPLTNVISFVAWGGVGKTALVNHWLKRRMARDNYRGAEKVYGWSFYSQGTSEGAASADLFINQALRWFGDGDPTAGTPWDKGERLASYIRQTRTLLILDGLEPLQYPPGFQEGRLKDPAVQALLVELAAHQPGLCVVSTRERITDLVEFEDSTVMGHNLEYLSPQAGAQILRSFSVKGDDEVLERAVKEVGGHAFSLTLLGSYLDEVLRGDIWRRNEIENLFDDTRYGDAAQKMIAAYEKWLGDGMELAILRLMGLFDRPADGPSIDVLRKRPAIVGLTEALQSFKAREWNQAVGKLRRIKLLGEVSPYDPRMLDSHPLVREHFKQQLKRERPAAWREANNRIYEHLKGTAKEFPDSVEEMTPLYAAVVHACSANRYAEGLVEIYWRRIHRGETYFNQGELGAFGADLGMLSSFFDGTWLHPSTQLNPELQTFVLAQVGINLRALGRVRESVQPLQIALQSRIHHDQLQAAANTASNLSQTYVVVGDLPKALELARTQVQLAASSRRIMDRVLGQISIAIAYHQMGCFEEATSAFAEAEHMQARSLEESSYPILYGVPGYQYCDFLLGVNKFDDVKARASKTLAEFQDKYPPLLRGLDNLSLGCVQLSEVEVMGTGSTSTAALFLDRAIEDLRLAGHMEYLPFGLLSRAKFYRFINSYERAYQDLVEVRQIASRGEMGLHLADYFLESARLELVQHGETKAREHLTTAKEMIDRMGYHRRDKEVAELEAQLA